MCVSSDTQQDFRAALCSVKSTSVACLNKRQKSLSAHCAASGGYESNDSLSASFFDSDFLRKALAVSKDKKFYDDGDAERDLVEATAHLWETIG